MRVHAAHGIQFEALPECNEFDEACLAPAIDAAEVALLCSIGPLDHVDRLAPAQQLKFALDGLTIIFGENGSGKSGYARAARRLCTPRIASKLLGDRKSVVSGKSVSVRVVLGGRRNIKKKTK